MDGCPRPRTLVQDDLAHGFRLVIQCKAWFYIQHPKTDEAGVNLRQMRYFVAIVDEGIDRRAIRTPLPR